MLAFIAETFLKNKPFFLLFYWCCFFPLYCVFGNPLLTAKNSSEPVRDTQAEKTGWQRYNRRGEDRGAVGRKVSVTGKKYFREREKVSENSTGGKLKWVPEGEHVGFLLGLHKQTHQANESNLSELKNCHVSGDRLQKAFSSPLSHPLLASGAPQTPCTRSSFTSNLL